VKRRSTLVMALTTAVTVLVGCSGNRHVRPEPGRTLPSLPPLSTRFTTTSTTTLAPKTYTVLPGDTFSGIAAKLGVDVDALAALNHLTNRDLITAGQVLYVPGDPLSTTSAAPSTSTN